MHAIRNVYKMIYRSGKTLEEVLPEIEQIAYKLNLQLVSL